MSLYELPATLADPTPLEPCGRRNYHVRGGQLVMAEDSPAGMTAERAADTPEYLTDIKRFGAGYTY